jgi:hypothetical protein
MDFYDIDKHIPFPPEEPISPKIYLHYLGFLDLGSGKKYGSTHAVP